MVKLDNDTFISQLTKLIKQSKDSGSLMMTMKRYDGRTKPHPREGRPRLPEPSEYMCLIRATLKKKKISTVIYQNEIAKFQQMYSNLLLKNLDGLKKMKKPKKSKAT